MPRRGDRPAYFSQKERAKYDAWVTAPATDWMLFQHAERPFCEVKCRGMSFDDAVDKCPYSSGEKDADSL